MLKKWKRICSIVCAAVLFVSGSFVVQNVKAADVIEKTDNIAKLAYTGTEYQELNGGAPILEDYIFSGWYTQEDCGVANVLKEAPGNGDTVYAKFVKKDVLSVKVQLRYGTNMDSEYTKIRLITSVDSLNYQEVGFDFSCGEKNFSCSTKTVYTTLFGYSSDSRQSYQPSSISNASKYFMVQNVTNFPKELFASAITVTPKWTTLDGTTVAGEARTFTIQEVFGGGYGVGYKTLLSAETQYNYIQAVGSSSVQTNIDSDDKFGVVYTANVPTGTSCSAANVFLYQWNTSICSGKENAFFYIYNPTNNDVGCAVQMFTNTAETYPISWKTLKKQQWTKIELPCATAEGGLRVYFPLGYTWNLNGIWKISSLFQKESTLAATEAGLEVSTMIDTLPAAETITMNNVVKYLSTISKANAAYQTLNAAQKAVLTTKQIEKLEGCVTKTAGFKTVLDASTNNMALDNRYGKVAGTFTKGTDAEYGAVVKLNITAEKATSSAKSFFTVNNAALNSDDVFFYIYNPTGAAVNAYVRAGNWSPHFGTKTLQPGWNLVQLDNAKKSDYVFADFYEGATIQGEWLVTSFYTGPLAGYDVAAMVDALPAANEITLENVGKYLSAISEANTAYGALSDAQKAVLTAAQTEKLTACSSKAKGCSTVFDTATGDLTLGNWDSSVTGTITKGTDAEYGPVFQVNITNTTYDTSKKCVSFFTVNMENVGMANYKKGIVYVYNPGADVSASFLSAGGNKEYHAHTSWKTLSNGWNCIELDAEYIDKYLYVQFPDDKQSNSLKHEWKISPFYGIPGDSVLLQ